MNIEDEIFEKYASQEVLEADLYKRFPSYGWVFTMKEIKENFDINERHMTDLLKTCSGSDLRSFIPELKEFKYHFSAYINSLYSSFDSFPNVIQRYVKEKTVDFKEIKTKYSKHPAVAILLKLRNVQVHARNSFSASMSVSYSISGSQGNKAEFKIPAEEMNQIVKEAESFTTPEALDGYLRSIEEKVYDPDNKKTITRYPIQKIIEDSRKEAHSFIDDAIATYMSVYADELFEREKVVVKLEAIEDWFIKNNLVRP